jgi:hypothetical protein
MSTKENMPNSSGVKTLALGSCGAHEVTIAGDKPNVVPAPIRAAFDKNSLLFILLFISNYDFFANIVLYFSSIFNNIDFF